MDIILPVTRFPAPGETVLGDSYDMTPGGKGANQALAARRAASTNTKVTLAGCVGDDGMGLRMLNGLRRDGVLTTGVAQSDKPTGMAVITTVPGGENQIIVAPGANMDASADQVPDSILGPDTILLMQGETPIDQNLILLEHAKKAGATTILNLSPVTDISLDHVDYLIVNEMEARKIAHSKDKSASAIAKILSEKHGLVCIVTQGAQGSVAVTPAGQTICVPALEIEKIIDTTGAGDAYCGTLAAGLHDGKPLDQAMRMASAAGSLACIKKGTQTSYAYLGDIEQSLLALKEAVIES